MNVDVIEDGVIRLKEVFNPIVLETTEGNRFTVCMRDNGLELSMLDDSIKHDGPEKYMKCFFIGPSGIEQLHPQASESEECDEKRITDQKTERD